MADDGPLASSSAGATATTSSTATTDSGSATATATGSTTATATSSTTATESATGSSSGVDSSTGPAEPVECGELSCDPGEVCVVPCCGGPAPGCFELEPGGDCGNGVLDKGGVECCQGDPDPRRCMQMQWCIPGPCIADPPYCVTEDMITCNAFECTVQGGCFGALVGDQLECRGCK